MYIHTIHTYLHTHIYIYIYTHIYLYCYQTSMIKMIIAIAMSIIDHTALKKSYLLYVSFT